MPYAGSCVAVAVGALGLDDRNRGARLIRTNVPPLVDRLDSSEPLVRARVKQLRLRTKAGTLNRKLGLDVLADDARTLRRFRRDLVAGVDPWSAGLRFGNANNASRRRYVAGLQRLLRALPAAAREALERAVQELYGTPPPCG